MKQYAMRFAVIRFMPYVQTREFANIGIVITHPKSGWFDFKIETRYSRLSRFFRHFDASAYRATVKAFSEELQYIKDMAAISTPEQIRAMLEHIARPREAVISTSSVGTTLAADPAQELTRLFDYYIGHSFAQSQHEAELTRHIQNLIRQIHTAYPFKESTIGDESGFHATLPLVQKTENGNIRKIIKPIYFGQKDPADIYHKADKWIASIKRLKRGGYIEQPEIMFAYQAPENPADAQKKALSDVLTELQEQQFLITDKSNIGQITQFAEQ